MGLEWAGGLVEKCFVSLHLQVCGTAELPLPRAQYAMHSEESQVRVPNPSRRSKLFYLVEPMSMEPERGHRGCRLAFDQHSQGNHPGYDELGARVTVEVKHGHCLLSRGCGDAA